MAMNRGVACMLAVALLLLAAIPTGVQSVGVCYGVHGSHLPSPRYVVQMYESKGIDSMRQGAPCPQRHQHRTHHGHRQREPRHLRPGPQRRRQVGPEQRQGLPGRQFPVHRRRQRGRRGDTQYILPAMKNVNRALAAAGLGNNIKVSTAVNSGVTAGFPPSQGTFNSDASSYMTPIARYLAKTGAPLLANIYPYFSYLGNKAQIDIKYALFTSPDTVVRDGSNAYQNLFDALVDTMYSALENASAGKVKIVVSESGWPSAGGDSATATNARTYNQNLINHVGQGTPKRPGPIETYIFAMFNENQKTGAQTERHFGLFNPDKSPA